MASDINRGEASVDNSIQHVFIIGSKSIGQYGGYETFVDRLIGEHENEKSIKYHVACKANGDGFMDESKLTGVTNRKVDKDGNVREFTYKNAHVFKLPCPNIGPAVAIYYDRAAVLYSIAYCRKHGIEHPIFYILTCRIGLFIGSLVKKVREVGGKYYLNPDGACEIMGSTGEKPVKSRLHGDSVFYPNSNTEYHIKNICSGILKRFCNMPMLLRQSGRAFFCWAFSKPWTYDPGIA